MGLNNREVKELDKKDIQAELRKRKKTDNSNGQVDKA